MAKKKAVAPSGTVYTQVNDSVYDWLGKTGAEGTIILRNNGNVDGTYWQYMGSSVPSEKRKIQDPEILSKHKQNILDLQKSNSFQTDWEAFKDVLKAIKDEYFSKKKQKGGKLSYLDLF